MSLEKIVKKITDDAHQEAERIIQESRQRAEQIKGKSQEEAAASEEEILKESEKLAQLEISRIVTQARLERKIEILSCKKQLIDQVLVKAFKETAQGRVRLNKEVIDKKGRGEEVLDEGALLEEMRPRFEKFIADILKL